MCSMSFLLASSAFICESRLISLIKLIRLTAIKGDKIHFNVLWVPPYLISLSQRSSKFPADSITKGHRLCKTDIKKNYKKYMFISTLNIFYDKKVSKVNLWNDSEP